jgi:hypothetical protein
MARPPLHVRLGPVLAIVHLTVVVVPSGFHGLFAPRGYCLQGRNHEGRASSSFYQEAIQAFLSGFFEWSYSRSCSHFVRYFRMNLPVRPHRRAFIDTRYHDTLVLRSSQYACRLKTLLCVFR